MYPTFQFKADVEVVCSSCLLFTAGPKRTKLKSFLESEEI